MDDCVKATRERRREVHKAYNGQMFDDEIRCNCGKLLAKIGLDGKIKVWCKACRKEVELDVEPYEP